jgi:hypothetical protein
LEGLTKATENLNQDRPCPNEDLNQTPPEYKPGALPLHQPAHLSFSYVRSEVVIMVVMKCSIFWDITSSRSIIESQLTFWRNMLFPFSGLKNKKQETNVKQVASRAIHLPRSQVYIGKQEGTCQFPLAHSQNRVNQVEGKTTWQFPLALSQNIVNCQETRQKSSALLALFFNPEGGGDLFL